MPQVPTFFDNRILAFGAASDSALDIPPIKVSLPLCPLNQGTTNSCGTTSLAMALNFLDGIQKGVEPSQHCFFTASQLDAGSR
ncbi:MAG: hypothetical protein K2X66_01155, partial [Cyanobacteria bacterium]|nr:hypothetical protein [Cyanobacteriota bacterium]